MALFGNKKIKEEKTSEKKDTSTKAESAKKETVKKTAVKKTAPKKKDAKKDAKKVVKKEDSASMKDLYAEKESKKASPIKKKSDVKARPLGKSLSANTLVKPLVTEKAANLAASGKYVFTVSMKANKIEVAKAISDTYGVEVEAVNIIRMKGKAVSRGRIKGFRSDFKKAIVTLKKGQSLEIYEGV